MTPVLAFKIEIIPDLQEIRGYCEIDVVDTCLVYCRFQFLGGQMAASACEEEMALLRHAIAGLEGSALARLPRPWPQRRLPP